MVRSCAILLTLSLLRGASAQFSPLLLQNASYWEPGRSEVDFYTLDLARDGQHYSAELLITYTPVFLDPTTLVAPETKAPGALPVIKMNSTATVARGLVPEQRSLTLLWRMDFMSLARATFAGTDGIATIFKAVQEKRENDRTSWRFTCESVRGKNEGQEIQVPSASAILWDELPLRVRMLDFAKSSGEFEIQIAPTFCSALCDDLVFNSAKVSFKRGERTIEVEIKQDAGSERFVLDADFPFLLREWKMADGSSLKMKNSIRATYETYSKPHDRERALKDPILRHPD